MLVGKLLIMLYAGLSHACLRCCGAEAGQKSEAVPTPPSDRSALVTYVHTWRSFSSLHPGVDFMLSTFESWRRSSGHYPTRKFDLVAVLSEPVAEKLQQHETVGHLCRSDKLYSFPGALRPANKLHVGLQSHSQCWLLTHNASQARDWEGFPLVHDILHLASDAFKLFTEEMRYSHLVVTPNGAMVTPLLPKLTTDSLLFSPAAYSWHPETRRKLREMAQQFHISHSGMHGIGDTWLGPTPAVIRLARAALPLLRQLLSATFEETGDSDSSLSDWLEDIDWEDLASPSSSAGLQPWNMGHAVKYAAEIAVHTLPDNWAWDTRLGPSTGAQQVGTMHDAAVIPPVLGNGAFDLHQLLRNTHAYCAAWAAGNKGQPGSLVHFAGLIACQGSETVAPREEQRYADTVQAPTPKQRRT